MVLELLRDLGEYVSESSSIIEKISQPLGRQYHYGMAICFDYEGVYRGIKMTQGSTDVIYKKGPSNGSDFTLVSKLGSSGVAKTVRRLSKNAEKMAIFFNKTLFEKLIEACLKSVNNGFEDIVSDLDDKLPSDSGQDKRVFLYWAILDGNKIKPFYNMKEVQEYLIDAQLNRYATKKEGDKTIPTEAHDSVCSICGVKSSKLYGNFSEIQCYNLDKIGTIAGGFDYSMAAQNFPICENCILNIQAGKSYAEKNLSFTLAGYSYWLLPKTNDTHIFNVVLESINESETRQQTLGKELDTITASQNEILDLIAEKMKTKAELLTLNLIFYEKKQNSWRIRAEIREVLPSRISTLYEAKRSIQSKKEMKISKKEQKQGYRFTLKSISAFSGDISKKSERKFLEYVESIFRSTKIDEEIVMRDIVNGILAAQKNDLKNKSNNFVFTVRDAWAMYLFLSEIGSLRKKGGKNMKNGNNAASDSYSQYMKEYAEFFENVYRRAAFLTGCFVSSVLYVQNSKRNSQPFAKKFMGRKLNKKIIKDLYVQGETKLRQYDSLGIVNKLNPILAESWMSCGDKWEISDDETTFAFMLGLNLGPKLAAENMEVKK